MVVFRKFGVLCFLVVSYLRFVILPYYRPFAQVLSQHQSTSKRPSTVSEIESIMYPKEKWQKKRTKLKIKVKDQFKELYFSLI